MYKMTKYSSVLWHLKNLFYALHISSVYYYYQYTSLAYPANKKYSDEKNIIAISPPYCRSEGLNLALSESRSGCGLTDFVLIPRRRNFFGARLVDGALILTPRSLASAVLSLAR